MKRTKKTQSMHVQPGQLLHVLERRIVQPSQQKAMDGARAGRFVAPGQSCMIVSVIEEEIAGEPVELHGFMTPGATNLDWIMLPTKQARNFWSA